MTLVAAGLLVRTLQEIGRVFPGFEVLGGAGIASLVPSVRGARVEPVQVLRDE